MKGIETVRGKSLLVKMIIFGTVLSILPVVLVGIFSYIQSSKQVQKQINHAELQFIRQVNSNIEQILMTVDHTLTNLLDSTVMQDALYNPLSATNFQLYNNLRSEITHLQSFDTKVEDLILINTRQDWIIKNSGMNRFSQHADQEKFLSYFNLNYSSSWVLLENRAFSDSIVSISNRSCAHTISLVKKLPNIRTEKFGLAFANIPVCSIAALINKEQEAEEVMIINEDQQIMVHHDTTLIGSFLSDHPVFHAKMNFEEPSGQIHLSAQDHPYTITYHKSAFNGWIYLSVISIDKLTEESRKIGWFTFIISIIIISISMICVWLITKRLYLPVNKLVQSIAGHDYVHSTKPLSEMQVIEDYIDQVFTSKTKLELELKDHTHQIRTLFLNRLYSRNIRMSEIHDRLDQLGLQAHLANWRSMTVLTMQVDTLENTRYESKDMDLLLFAVSNIVEETIAKGDRFPIVWMDRTLVILVGMDEEYEEELSGRIYKITESLKSLIEQYLSLSVSIGISLPFQDINQASRAYEEGLEAVSHKIKLGKGVIIPYSSINAHRPSVLYEYPTRAEHAIIDAIKIADREEVETALLAWMEEALAMIQSPSDYQISLMRLLNRILVFMQESGIAFKQIGMHQHSLYEEFLALHMNDEIEVWFKEKLILPLIQVYHERRNSQFHNLSEKIIDMIQNHYDSDFTLEDCAIKLHYNANYLSRVFKSETNHTFSEYLANYRIQMAKQWLTQTEKTVKEIADRLRYKNSHNFIRSFRKHENMTPGQYREMYTSGD
jgi:AraC-like DNA-binding protein